MPSPVSAVTCNNPYVCQPDGVTRDEPQAFPPVALGGGMTSGVEPPSHQRQMTPKDQMKCMSSLASLWAGNQLLTFSGYHPDSNNYLEDNQGFLAAWGLIAVGAVVGATSCFGSKPKGNPPSGGTPGGKNDGPYMSGNRRTTTGWTSAYEALEPKSSPNLAPWVGLLLLLGLATKLPIREVVGAGLVAAPDAEHLTPSWEMPVGSGFDIDGYPNGAL